MRKVFAALATLFLLVVVAQFFFAATGAFSTDPDRGAFRPHHALGYVLFLLPLVMALVAALARLTRRLMWLSLLAVGLTTVEVVIAKVAMALGGAPGGLVFGLHGVCGLVLLAAAWQLFRQAGLPAARIGAGA
ncbi:hypothetical protein Cs7R123_60000 [Catellatospora sp. TT07R-123]|uniref:DUF6220 domain-containing protein n=1 Tax=Catellatospora sp. TT07R-123 TaxID=2733863 RepID=UPI001B1FF90A|nr:DUF6220 domain-containing protein [Catellatospora sp. TT07R-123]GHJ48658.1 hypothetical protein Cs7R123_60000 [Catellatospora sp. TT07R-123]